MKAPITFFLILLSSILSISCGKKHPEVDGVTINYMNSQTLTFARISCSRFSGEVGKNGFMSKTLQSREQIDRFMNDLEDLQSSPIVDSIDVRAKALIHYKTGKVSIACLDAFGNIELDHKPVGHSHSLLSFLHSTCAGF